MEKTGAWKFTFMNKAYHVISLLWWGITEERTKGSYKIKLYI